MRKRLALALAEALCPPAADPVEARRVLHCAADLLVSRVAVMATPMRFALDLLFELFGLAALFTVGRPFASAPVEGRRRHCDRAASWPVVPFKDLVRLARAMALLAHYDDPGVRARLGFIPGGTGRVA
jgi:hypothetical protein